MSIILFSFEIFLANALIDVKRTVSDEAPVACWSKVSKACAVINHGIAQATITMKPSYDQCSSCETTLIQVEIPNLAREHVIERHYRRFTPHEEIDPERSLFFENAISPQRLFNTVIFHLRSGLQASWKERHLPLLIRFSSRSLP